MIGLFHQLSVTVIAYHTLLCLKDIIYHQCLFLYQLDCIYYIIAPYYLFYDSSNADIDTEASQKEQMPR